MSLLLHCFSKYQYIGICVHMCPFTSFSRRSQFKSNTEEFSITVHSSVSVLPQGETTLLETSIYHVIYFIPWFTLKAELWRIDAFELCCWRRLLRVPWTAGEIQPVHPKGDQPWDFFGRNDAKAETPVLWPPHVKRPWCWEGLGTGGEGDNRGWDGWMASLTLCTLVWVNSRSWW